MYFFFKMQMSKFKYIPRKHLNKFYWKLCCLLCSINWCYRIQNINIFQGNVKKIFFFTIFTFYYKFKNLWVCKSTSSVIYTFVMSYLCCVNCYLKMFVLKGIFKRTILSDYTYFFRTSLFRTCTNVMCSAKG